MFACIGDALAAARGRIPASEARLLLGALLHCSTAQIAAYPERELAPALAARFADWLERRAQGEPVAYLLGVREFFGRQFGVTPAVLIPRPETELIVELVLSRSTALNNIPAILDLGTGSGALAVTLALELPGARLVAVDCSAEALGVARHNADALGAQVEFIESDWFAALPGRRFDFIVSNPPYIAEDDPHLAEGDVRFEPLGALASGHAGLDDLARIAADAPAFLVPGGWLMMEHGYDQAGAVRGLLASAGFDDVASARDLAGIERVSFGRWRAS
ncbi:peptide chain release factor N(5)-glutamine methyltransferase [Zoogloea sp.]|uniref:peptide chain release factor N(5)-glutamine methyltransferase n=1 Tax=Zoogloea sp. TaxID=49181 RepID=UPI0035B3385F